MKYFLISYTYFLGTFTPEGIAHRGEGDIAVEATIFPVRNQLFEAIKTDTGCKTIAITNIYQFPSETEYKAFYGK